MKKRSILLIFISFSATFCSDDPQSDEEDVLGNWTKTTPFKGRPRTGAVVFTIGSKAFVGLGYDGDEYISDFYSYDINSGYWETKKSFPGILRERAVSFSANGKGYIGLGYNRDRTKEELGDFWQYDPATDTWQQVSDFGGTARYNAVGFAIGSRAFVGTGYDGDKYNSDFWEYDTDANTWKEIQSYPGEKIERGLAFTIGENGYVCTGRNNGLYNLDFWQFNSENRSWTRLSPRSDDSYYDEFKLAVQRHDAVSMVIDDKAYIIGGISSTGAVDKSVYEFDYTTSVWKKKTSFEGSARSMAVTFVLDGRGFIGTGQNGSNTYDDVWEFKPLQEYDDEN